MCTGADCKSQAVAAENGRRDCPGSLIKDRSPEAWTMAFPVHYNTTEAEKVGVTCHQKSHSLYGEGIEEVVSPYGCGVLCYSREVE